MIRGKEAKSYCAGEEYQRILLECPLNFGFDSPLNFHYTHSLPVSPFLSSSSPLSLSTIGAAGRIATGVDQRDDLGVQPHGVARPPPAARLPLPRPAARQRLSYLWQGRGSKGNIRGRWETHFTQGWTQFTLLSCASERVHCKPGAQVRSNWLFKRTPGEERLDLGERGPGKDSRGNRRD